MNTFAITSSARSYPTLPYEAMKNDILGKTYDLSLRFVGTQKAREYNQTYRQKSYAPNVLSFPLSKTTGEIVIAPVIARAEAKKFSMTAKGYIGFLFIHGCLHLKGMDHGATMERAEARLKDKYRLR